MQHAALVNPIVHFNTTVSVDNHQSDKNADLCVYFIVSNPLPAKYKRVHKHILERSSKRIHMKRTIFQYIIHFMYHSTMNMAYVLEKMTGHVKSG